VSIPRLCILTGTYYPVVGGGETQTRNLAEGLMRRGSAATVITRRTDPALQAVDQVGGVDVYRLAPVGPGQLKKWGLLLTSPLALIRRRQRYDVVMVSGFSVLGLPVVLTARLLGKPCILKADILGEMSGAMYEAGLRKLGIRPNTWVLRSLLRWRNRALRLADAFVAICSVMADEFQEHGVHPQAIYEIPNSVGTNRFHPVSDVEKRQLRRELNLPPDDILVTFTGRLVSYKGLPLLLRIWQAIHHEHRRARLLIVGTGGLDIHNCEAELRAYTQAHDLGSSVCFTGAVENVHQYLQASDLFVFPTEREAFGISLIEAMACALPVISTHVGGLADILVHRQNGWVIEAGDGQQLGEALHRLMTDPALRADLGASARRTVEERYTTEQVVQAYIDLLAWAVAPAEHALPQYSARGK
jgi:glycosyltransferase involved in cell wall biosynthesis